MGGTNVRDISLTPPAETPSALQQLLFQRKSRRNFSRGRLTLDQVSKIAFSAQGITRKPGYRTVPSAGALYPLEIYLLLAEVEGTETGVYKYKPASHSLEQNKAGDPRSELARAALGQSWMAQAQLIVLICAVFSRITGKYGQRGIQYVYMEAGGAAQNISLQAVELNLGSTLVGAFQDREVTQIIQARAEEEPLLIIPVGRGL